MVGGGGSLGAASSVGFNEGVGAILYRLRCRVRPLAGAYAGLAVVVAIVRLRINPVIALAVGAAAIGILTGLGPLDTVSTMTQGFGEVMMDAGLLIAWGVLIGAMLNEMGAVTRLVEALMRVFGRRGIPFASILIPWRTHDPRRKDHPHVGRQPRHRPRDRPSRRP